MEKEYEFEVTYNNGKTNMKQKIFSEGVSILQAKNKFKSLFPNYKIIACVRKGETQRSIQKRAREENNDNNAETAISGKVIAGIGISAIGAISAFFFK
jgi:hypothetical protein